MDAARSNWPILPAGTPGSGPEHRVLGLRKITPDPEHRVSGLHENAPDSEHRVFGLGENTPNPEQLGAQPPR